MSVEKTLVFGGINPDGVLSKITTIRKAIREIGAGVWMMQETKVSQPGKIKIDGFIIYEHTRTEKEGGGLAICALKSLNPAFIRDGGEVVEALTVNIHVKNITISCNTAYGPQESSHIQKKNDFWNYLQEECDRAKNEGNGFLIQGDLNSWLGPDIIKSDNKPQNQNGKLLVNFVKNNQLTIVNSLPLCKGTTTWARTRLGVKLTSTIDFFIVCGRVLPFVKEMVIDNDKEHTITNFKNGSKITESDHAPMWLKLNLKISPQKTENVVVLNFKDQRGQQMFKENTSITTEFTNCFKGSNPFHTKMENWKHLLDKHCAGAFPKIRIRNTHLRPSKADKLISQRNSILKDSNTNNIDELEHLNVKIANTIAEEERLKCHVMKNFCGQNGSVNVSEMWKIKKKLWPNKASTLPTAKLNHQGNLVSTASEINKIMRKEYEERLRSRPVHPLLKKLYKAKIINYKLHNSKQIKSPPFTMKELENVLRTSKTGKARDPEGMVRELFQPNMIGSDLKQSLLYLLNSVKATGVFPKFMRKATIITIPKKAKSRLHLKNERGIFLVNIIRGIFMKVLFQRKSDMINSNMSDSNNGGQKIKSSINHIWVLNGIIHEQLSSVKNPPIVIQQYNYTQMFDGMKLGEALSDLYSSGVQDDTVHLLYEANKAVEVRVKTPFGLTDEVVLEEVILQGEVWGPTLASNQVDTFGKEMLEEDVSFIFKYKRYIPVPILGMIDDVIGVTLAGYQSAQLNSYINVKTAEKYLQFGQDKCKAMVVGKRVETFHIPQLMVDTWESSHTKDGRLLETFGGKKPIENKDVLTYLGMEISKDGRNMNTIVQKRNKQNGKKKMISNILKPLGQYTFECGMILLNSLIRSSVLYGTEAMYNVTENEIREIERIEEKQMKNIFKAETGIQVPLHIMYLDGGQVPARYQIKRYKLNFMQYILQQDEESLMY